VKADAAQPQNKRGGAFVAFSGESEQFVISRVVLYE
jgi:hypothetical protein